MSKIAHVVEGEASESDSEVESAKPHIKVLDIDNSKQFVIAGEAPESDDESKISPLNLNEEKDMPLNRAGTKQNTNRNVMYESILHQKLWECNVSLRATMEGLIKYTTNVSVEKLTMADKTLLSVQESMRATNANLTLARARLKQIHLELEKANCSNALPTVKIR